MAKSKNSEPKDIEIKNKSFLFLSIDLETRDKAEKIVRTNKGRMAKNIRDSLDYLVIGNDTLDEYLKVNLYEPAKSMPTITFITYAEFENAASVSKTANQSKSNPKNDSISKSELVKYLWDVVGNKIYNHKYKTVVSKQEGDYLENEGLSMILNELGSDKVEIEIKAENFIDLNFKEDFSENFNTDTIEGDIEYQTNEIENWINRCTSTLINDFNNFTVLGGEILFPESGSNPWENKKTIYLEMPLFEFKLKDLNKNWKKGKYFLEDEEFDSFKDEVIS